MVITTCTTAKLGVVHAEVILKLFKTKYCYSLVTTRALGTITITRPLVPLDN